MRNKKSRGNWKRYSVLAVLAFLLLTTFLYYLFIVVPVNRKLPDAETLKMPKSATGTHILSADGVVMGRVYSINRQHIEDVPDHLKHALIATEDKRFFEHHGIDYIGLMRAIVGVITFNRSGGGSTLTQQLAKNAFGRNPHERFALLRSKYREWRIALMLEEQFTKEELLMMYLNTVPFGDEVYGVETAARHYFNVPVSQLEIHQSALLVGLLKGNSLYHPRRKPEAAMLRRNVVLALMQEEGILSPDEKRYWQEKPLDVSPQSADEFSVFGYAIRQIHREANALLEGLGYDLETDGLRIETTINYKQSMAYYKDMLKHLHKSQSLVRSQRIPSPSKRKQLENILRKQNHYQQLSSSAFKQRMEVSEARHFINHIGEAEHITGTPLDSLWATYRLLKSGAIAIDPNTGSIRMYFGGHHARLHPYDHVQSKRQVASTFKPILAVAALQSGFELCDYFPNEVPESAEAWNWQPKNVDGTNEGYYSLKGALIHSMNLPSIQMGFEVGLDKVRETAFSLGWTAPLPVDPSIFLGSAENNLYEMVQIYALFANGGYGVEPHFVRAIYNSKGEVIFERAEEILDEPSISDTVADMINRILVEVPVRGTATGLQSGRGWAAKTGTSSGGSDAWTFAYTPEVVFGVWVGGSDPSITASGMGSGKLAVPLAKSFIKSSPQNTKRHNINLVEDDCVDYSEKLPREHKGIFDFFKRNKSDKDNPKKEKKGLLKRIFG